ncbi:MAG: MMPL family transporter [Deltaproteobacteria bacterium]|nr:MMPL family transporter [Deltaproteobacteria bacterium]
MKRWIVSLARRPRLSVAVLLAVTAVALGGLTRIRFDGSLASLSVPDDPARVFNEEIARQFGDEEIGIVLLEADDVYAPEVIETLAGLTRDLGAIPGVSRTLSLANASDATQDVFSPPPLLPDGPIDAGAVAHLRERVKANPIYIPHLVAVDGKALAITVFFKGAVTTADEAAVDASVLGVLETYKSRAPLSYTGMSHIRVQAVERMRGDLLGFLPISLALMAVVLWFMFRSVRAVVLPLVALGMGVGCLVGMMGWFDEPITLATLVLPSLLLVIGGSYAIHIVDAYLEHLRDAGARGIAPEVLFARTLQSVALPVLVSAVTNAIGFGSLVIHPIPAIAGLGKFAVLGTAIVTVGCLLGIPLVFLCLPTTRRTAPGTAADHAAGEMPRLDRAVRWAGALVIDHRGRVLACAALLTIAGGWAAGRVTVDTDFLKAFRESSPVRRSFASISDKLAGPNPIAVVLTGPTPGYFRDIASLRRVNDFQEFCEELDGVDKSISLIDYMEELDLGLQSIAGEVSVDESGNVVEQPPAKSFWLAPAEQLPQIFQLVAASPRTFSGLVDRDFQRLHLTLRTSLTGSRETAELVEQIKRYGSVVFPHAVDVQLTGTLVVMSAISDRILQGQVESTALAFAIIFVLLSLMFLSLRVGIVAMIPNIVPNVLFFGVMGLGGIELNLATSIIAAVALGVSVDDTVHYMARLNRLVKTTASQREALLETLGFIGRPVVATTLTLAAGFMVMLTSNFVIISAFGWLTAMTMLIAMVCNLLLLPAILATVPVVSVWDLASSRLGPRPHVTIPLFHGLGRFGVRLVVLLGRLRTFARGDYLARKGEEGHEMYLLMAGNAEVQLDGGTHIPLGRGGIVGEMAVLRRSLRGADVIATSDVYALVIDKDFLRRLRIRYPRLAAKFFLNVARILSDRLEESNRRR